MNRRRSPEEGIAAQPTSEVARLWRLMGRWITFELNRFFSLSIQGSRSRFRIVVVCLAAATAVGMIIHEWLSPRPVPGIGILSKTSLLSQPLLLYGLTTILVIGIAAALAQRAAGYFVMDIFELSDVTLAWKFLSNITTGSTNVSLHLAEGRIAENSRKSPLVLIGGPGRVLAEPDTAAVFERADGMPHVIGAHNATAQRDGAASEYIIEGFERLREPLVDLRDQYIGGAGQDPMRVAGRSLDGLPISVVDVRGVFSARRDPSSLEAAGWPRTSYPVRPEDIANLIYHQSVPVLASGEEPSGVPEDWTEAMRSLIRRSLREFMSENRLTDYLAGTGAHEAETAELREDSILARSLQVSNDLPPATRKASTEKPAVRPRTDLSARFKKYGSEFSTRAQQLGLELHWIGVGTWKLPEASLAATVNEKQLEAWRMNRENRQRSDLHALELVAEEAELDGTLQLLEEVPIASHERNLKRYSDRGVLAECLLQDFWAQLGEALDVYYQQQPASPELQRLEQAVLRIENLLGIQQVGSMLEPGTTTRVRPRPVKATSEEGPPAPGSRAEAKKYGLLLQKLDGSYKVAEAMIANEARRHNDLSREALIARILERFERHGR
jgi:hypothetical protein